MTTVDELLVRLLHAPRVLVVEDKADELGAMLRQNYGCHVDATDSERRVGTLLVTENYDLVLLNLSLGCAEAILRTLKVACPETPVAVTLPADADVKELVGQVGTLMLCQKPVTSDVLEHLFRVFKLRVCTRAVTDYCERLKSGQATVAGSAC
jgi:DNA-binding response OmpR family regulator